MSNVVVVDLKRVLDESAPGKRGAAAMQAKYEEMKAQYEKLKSRGTTERGKREADAAAASFEQEAQKTLEAERQKLRDDVLALARPVIAAVMTEKKVDVVVDAAVVLASTGAADITDEVIRRLS